MCVLGWLLIFLLTDSEQCASEVRVITQPAVAGVLEKQMEEVVIVAAARTAVGKFGGSLAKIPASELGAHVIKGLIAQTGIDPTTISEAILGQVLTAAVGQNPARQAVIKAGLPNSIPAYTISKVCGSGLKATHLAAQAIKCGDASIIIAGGQENMSAAPHAMNGSRDGFRMGDFKMVDTMIVDGLWDVYNQYHMGVTAENVAKKFEISRAEQDEFALQSQLKAEAAQKAGKFKDEILPLEIASKKATVTFDADEYIKPGSTIEALSGLRPAFSKDGSVTAGNASGLNDGAAAAIMGMGPVSASRLCLKKAGWTPQDLDLMEINEAFAAQAIAVNRDMGWDTSKINVNGGAIAIGHPIGASGARILVTLLHEMKRRDAKKGLAALCIGGGMGVALAVERD